ncbi:MAG: restriction endonuclease [Caldilineaceae bacterium]|nr:restriction endonuclease [Caldilineaceae bacterium]
MAINQATRDRLAELLQSMPPERFEALITELLLQMGFDETTVTVTPYRGDGGIDVVGIYRAAGLTEVNAAVQVKRWRNNVQTPTVTQLRGSLQVHQQGIIITTSSFSAGARKEASAPGKTHIGLINGEELLNLLIKYRVGVIEKTFSVATLDDDWWGELLAKGTNIEPALVSVQPESALTPQPPRMPDDPTGHKPVSFSLRGKSYPVQTWGGLLVQVCTLLAAEYGSDFHARVMPIRGRKRLYFAESPELLFKAAQIGELELWAEINLSAKDILKQIHRVLEACELAPSEFIATTA